MERYYRHGADLDGKKAFNDFCDVRETCMLVLDDFVHDLGYEMAGRIQTYLLQRGMQINEHGLKLIADNNETTCIRAPVRERRIYLRFFIYHENTMCVDN